MFGAKVEIYAIVVIALTLFGVLYDSKVDEWQRQGKSGLYTAAWVVGGCMMTLIGGGIVYGLEVAVGFFFLFAASGTPMILGAFKRHSRRDADTFRNAEQLARLLLELENGDATKDRRE